MRNGCAGVCMWEGRVARVAGVEAQWHISSVLPACATETLDTFLDITFDRSCARQPARKVKPRPATKTRTIRS